MNRADEVIGRLQAEIETWKGRAHREAMLVVDRDARIEDLEAQLEDTESRRANAARNASAFEARMGDLQVENGKLNARIAEQARSDCERLQSELAALKAQQPSAGVVDERDEFEAWRVDKFCGGIERLKKCSNAPDVYYYTAEQEAWRAWQARARLNHCRAQAVPDGAELKVLRAFYQCCASITDQLADSPKSALDPRVPW